MLLRQADDRQTTSGMYFSRASRQKTTRNAVSGMARIIPMIPFNADPQKKIANASPHQISLVTFLFEGFYYFQGALGYFFAF